MEDKGLGFGAILPPFRLLLSGKGMGPSLFAIAELLGKEECLARMEISLQKLS